LSEIILNTTKINFKFFFENSQSLLAKHNEDGNIYSIISSNVQRMRIFLETPQILEELSKQNIDTLKLGKEVDFLADVLTTIFNNTWYRHSDDEIDSIKKYYEEIYLQSIYILKRFSVSSTEHMKWLNARLK